MSGFACGVDIGGTFTDCVLIADDGRVAYGKALSSPDDSFRSGFFGSIDAAAAQLGLDDGGVYTRMDRLISHGSTVATNIVVERKGARIGLLTTKGFEDTVRIMRGMGRATGEPPETLLKVAETFKPEPLVPAERVYGIAERIDSLGDEVVALDEDGVAAAADALVAAGVDTIAIAFLWSVRNAAHEERARDIVAARAPGVFVTISSEISKAVGEYERFVATLINAYVGPVTSRYLDGVQDRLTEIGFAGELHIMQCHGGMVPLRVGADRPIFTIGSGPVGGLIGCARVCEQLGTGNIIASDMGGTSFDVGIIRDGEPLAAEETLLGKFRYRVPALEVVSIGAGGGSIAWIDRHGGGLRVGPHSASSLPGPACYGRGGTEPTVTDADLILGYIAPEATFGTSGERGGFHPQPELAERAIRERIAEPLGLSLTDAALGIVEVANAKMAAALENEIIGRGFDPRDFTLMSYGGAGPFHAVGYAAELGIDTIVVPGEAASVWSAFGISQADIRYQFEESVVRQEPFSPQELEADFGGLRERALATLSEREDPGAFSFRRYARMRFQWQLHELEFRLPDEPLTEDRVREFTAAFVAMYQERYGEAALLPGARLEIVSLRLEPAIAMGSGGLDRLTIADGPAEKGSRPVYFERGAGAVDTPAFRGDALAAGRVVEGPAVVDLAITGIVVPPGSTCERRETGDFVLRLH
ncbi:hydantoinase/oxoprolinase family protein [Capillimicrobium parvum]|uniref:Acetophenone carboxylase gamma subunit n=1 Tax=Capillimicrobium parvum TaxID=2884022 RepID=A0A9E6XZ18_9ACTN|nr:hydantoinase/oxoprolinase family protein [Capillimicrobium parvum]UGS36925.1 Acetophenone carboxylase gamma subunit [Capillimicrobium parvum]